MNRLRGSVLIVAACLAGSAVAAKQVPKVTVKNAESSRMDRIWSGVYGRLSQQTDVFFDNGDFLASIQLLKVLTVIHPEDYEQVTNLGWMLENVENYPAAEGIYQRYITQNPKDPDRALPMADFYARRKKYAGLPPLLEPILSTPGHYHPNNYRDLAHAYERLKKLKDAERIWKEYIALAPDDLTAKVNLARVEKKLATTKSD